MNQSSKVSTLLKALRSERREAQAAGNAQAVRKIDFIGKSIVRLMEKHP